MVALHPDEATEAIVDFALSRQIPFAVVRSNNLPKTCANTTDLYTMKLIHLAHLAHFLYVIQNMPCVVLCSLS